MTPAVFLDRDGTLMKEVHYCADARLVKVYPGVSGALRRLKDAGFRMFIVTNQSGIGRGLFSEAQYREVQAELIRQIGPGLIDATYYCPDVPGASSPRRKPNPAMVLEAAREYDIDLSRSYFIGDKSDDIECGRRAGTRTILVATGYGSQAICQPTCRAQDLPEAVNLVLEDLRRAPIGGCDSRW